MGKPKGASVRVKWLILIVILTIAIATPAFVFWSGIFSPGKVQKIYFSSCEWSKNPSSGDPYILLSIANTGADELVINKIWINGTLLDSTEWESFPSMRFQPGDQGVLQITPSLETLEIFEQGTTYLFTLETAAGNAFSHTAKAESLDFTFMKTEEVKVLSINRSTWSNATATLTLKNSGTSEITIESVRVNDNSATLTPVGSATLTPGEQRDFSVSSTYVSGTKYEFAFYTATGNRYPYTSTAP